MSKGFTLIVPSLHHNLADHLRVDRTEVGKSSGFGERVGELFIRIQYLGLERLRIIRADNRMRNVVAIGPGNCGSRRHRERCWPKTEIIDFYFRSCRLLGIRREVS